MTRRASACPHVPVFTGDVRRELDELLTRYPTKMAALLPALWIVQRERGWVSEEAMAEVAELLELTPGVREGRGDVLHDVPPAPGRKVFHPGVHDVAVRHLRRRGCRESISCSTPAPASSA